MDWLRSALNEDSSSDEESSQKDAGAAVGDSNNHVDLNASSTSSERKNDNIANADDEDSVDEDNEADTPRIDEEGSPDRASLDDDSPAPRGAPEPLFSFTTARQAEDYSRAAIVRINPPQLSEEDLRELEAPAGNDPWHDDSQAGSTEAQPERARPAAGQKGSMDTMEIMQCFNMIHSGSNIKPPKQRDWFGSDIRVTEIKADDLRMGQNEKSARYSTSKAALLEGRATFQAPARRLETDDGHVLTTNVMRKTSKRKHQVGSHSAILAIHVQISWLAADAQERELELLERTAQARKTKHETQMKYGW
ncbi:hypothetical protein, conserved [Babesia bigemina]|uniref:Uncharacterized protein n=1 Tax=Babesia bigemina TaxID=5866 RepID=A0A061D067_BABBI|nr:hypothetical protein, conserved [Babesia bigemina]CDR94063.1 hypothetical protein, conserved [Babesia bigemina]|eukprot:XP_012766249.1 hypothetical protein, conserved [Babesia bigemina]